MAKSNRGHYLAGFYYHAISVLGLMDEGGGARPEGQATAIFILFDVGQGLGHCQRS